MCECVDAVCACLSGGRVCLWFVNTMCLCGNVWRPCMCVNVWILCMREHLDVLFMSTIMFLTTAKHCSTFLTR